MEEEKLLITETGFRIACGKACVLLDTLNGDVTLFVNGDRTCLTGNFAINKNIDDVAKVLEATNNKIKELTNSI